MNYYEIFILNLVNLHSDRYQGNLKIFNGKFQKYKYMYAYIENTEEESYNLILQYFDNLDNIVINRVNISSINLLSKKLYLDSLNCDSIDLINRELSRILFVNGENNLNVNNGILTFLSYNDDLIGSIKSRSKEIEKLPAISFDDFKNITLDFYKVGNACTSSISINKNPYIILDFGKESGVNNDYLIELLQKLDSNGFFILSHYHEDHYNLFKYISEEGMKRTWIIPDFDHINDISKKQLIKKIEKYNNFYIIKDNTPFNCIKKGDLEIYKTNVKRSYNNNENLNSLAVLVKINKKIILFPGDGPYDEYNIYEKDLDYLVAFHHGAKYPKDRFPFNVKEFAVVNCSFPCNKKHKHPQYNHLEIFKEPRRFAEGECYYYDNDKNKIKDYYSSIWHGDVRNIDL